MYQKNGKNEALKKIFLSSGATSYNHQKLIEALRGLIGDFEPRPIKEEKGEISPRKKTKANKGYAVEPNHPELLKLYRERALLKNQITLLRTQTERKKQAFKILDITDTIEKILFFGFEQPKARAYPKNPIELYKLYIRNLKYRAKYKNREEMAAEIARREEEIKHIKKVLNIKDGVRR